MPLTLPGFEGEPEYGTITHPLRSAVQATLDELNKAGLLLPHHAALAASALSMAEAVESGTHSRRASAAAMAMAQLLAVLDRLPQPTAGTAEGDSWEERAQRLLEAAP